MASCEPAERGQSIFNLDAIESGMTTANLDDRGYRATSCGLRQIGMAVQSFASQRDEY
jgi:hypothetical protein